MCYAHYEMPLTSLNQLSHLMETADLEFLVILDSLDYELSY